MTLQWSTLQNTTVDSPWLDASVVVEVCWGMCLQATEAYRMPSRTARAGGMRDGTEAQHATEGGGRRHGPGAALHHRGGGGPAEGRAPDRPALDSGGQAARRPVWPPLSG